MHRIDTEGSNGVFTDGNPATGQLGTLVDAAYQQDLQENLCQAIEHAGIPLAKGDALQLYNAIVAIATGVMGTGAGTGGGSGSAVPTSRKVQGGGLIAGGGALNADLTLTVPKASAADVLAGTRDDAAVTPAGFAGLFASTAGASGYCRMPGGVIMQWGGSRAAGAEGLFNGAFPIAFPSSCDRVILTAVNATGSDQRDLWCQLVSTTLAGFTGMYQRGGGSNQNSIDGYDFFAIGR